LEIVKKKQGGGYISASRGGATTCGKSNTMGGKRGGGGGEANQKKVAGGGECVGGKGVDKKGTSPDCQMEGHGHSKKKVQNLREHRARKGGEGQKIQGIE